MRSETEFGVLNFSVGIFGNWLNSCEVPNEQVLPMQFLAIWEEQVPSNRLLFSEQTVSVR